MSPGPVCFWELLGMISWEQSPRRKILGENGSWEKKVPRRKRFLGEKGS
jgi:hypothetical protein